MSDLAGVVDVVFSLVIGYLGALEFLYVVRHLYHWSFRHPAGSSESNASDDLQRLQQSMRDRLATAQAVEAAAGGMNAMQDGVLYSDGFRVDPAQLNTANVIDERRKQIAAELERQKRIEAETRKQLEEAEAKLLQEQKQKQAEEVAQRQKAEREMAEAAENERRIVEAERQRERETAEREIAEKAAVEQQQRAAAEQKRMEAEQAAAAAELERQQLEAEAAESERSFLAAERAHEEQQRDAELLQEQAEEDAEQERRDAEIVRKLLEAERSRKLSATESELEEDADQTRQLLASEYEREQKQKQIEENARLFLEAEEEMVILQQRMLEATAQQEDEEAGLVPVVEEPCIKKIVPPKFAAGPTTAAFADDSGSQPLVQSVKTQFGQTSDSNQPYSVITKTLHFPSVSDDGTSIEPNSSQQSSSLSTPPSEIVPTERQEPEGEDNVPDVQYTDEYLRSLDGIKSRPLIREDGSGRRRAFKKRRSSGSSTSSHASREEEVKMFTSLEEEELRQGEKADYKPVQYTSEPTLKVKTQHRRHKRSPAKDIKPKETDSTRGSLEMLGEEDTNPWGEVVPEHYKNTDFWRREKTMSIDEEDQDLEVPAGSIGVNVGDDAAAANLPKTSSFEDATQSQNEQAANALQCQLSKEGADGNIPLTANKGNDGGDNKPNLESSQITENASITGDTNMRASSSPGLRRSPRIDEMNQYAERWRAPVENDNVSPGSATITSPETPAAQKPTITIEGAEDFGSWRDEHGLLMQGLSDFYDFQASVNPSRSRSTSRNPSPARSAPTSPQPKNVVNNCVVATATLDVYDDTGIEPETVFCNEQLTELMESMNATVELATPIDGLQYVADDPNQNHKEVVSMVYELEVHDENTVTLAQSRSRSRSHSPLPTAENLERSLATRHHKRIKQNDEYFDMLMENSVAITVEDMDVNTMDEDSHKDGELSRENIRLFVESLRADRSTRSRSRCRSPLPTADNLQIQQNDELIENLRGTEHSEAAILEQKEQQRVEKIVHEECTQQHMQLFVDSLRAERSTRSRSRSRSPLPTAGNIERSLESRRAKRIQQNDEIFEKLQSTFPSPELNDAVGTVPPLPKIAIECADDTEAMDTATASVDDDCSSEAISKLVEALRLNRSRSHSRSKTPLPASIGTAGNQLVACDPKIFEQLIQRAQTPEAPPMTVEYVYDIVEAEKDVEMQIARDARSRSPSRSKSLSPTRILNEPDTLEATANFSDYYDFHTMLNLEASVNRTLIKNTEEIESALAAKQRELDIEALQQLTNACEEVELRLLSPTDMERQQLSDFECETEMADSLTNLPIQERMRKLRCSPTTPDYDRTMSEEWRDVQRIKQELIEGGFKRSTYVGESMDLGSEYEPLRREAAEFRRSQSPTPSLPTGDLESARAQAATYRAVQAAILDELTASSYASNEDRYGAKPKHLPESDRSFTQECQDTMRLKEAILTSGEKRSTYMGESVDLSAQMESMRQRNAEFQRSRSQTRSPPSEIEAEELAKIDAEVAKRELQDKLLDEFAATTVNFENFSRHLNPDFLDSERRASDSMLIQKPELLIQFQDDDSTCLDLEPEEYHHFRRYSLAQEQQVEEYPNDDFVYISQIEVRTPTGTRTWLREDFYSDDLNDTSCSVIDSLADEIGMRVSTEKEKENIEQSEIGAITELDNDALPLPVAELCKTDMVNSAEECADGVADPNALENPLDELELDAEDEQDRYDSNGSEDERQTVVEMEDDLDEGISDYNERGGPTDESLHETSECEEAEREADRYAGRSANDWGDVENVEEFLDYGIGRPFNEQLQENEGAVGGVDMGVSTPYSDPDSLIEQIYNEAIKNRKQSGILREYDNILQELQSNCLADTESDKDKLSTSDDGADENYALWDEAEPLEKPGNLDSSKNLLEQKRRGAEVRYLGDASVSARQSTRLRSRYGYVPQLQSTTAEDIEVDLNYRPKREYNWRKNFKLDDDTDGSNTNAAGERDSINVELIENSDTNEIIQQEYEQINGNYWDMRRYSLGGESVTLFSRSPPKEELPHLPEEESQLDIEYVHQDQHVDNETGIAVLAAEPEPIAVEPTMEKTKKKSKKKTRKESKTNYDVKDEDDSENQFDSRRSSSATQMDTVDSPKRKSRSRRSSRSSLTNDEGNNGLFSPRNSVGYTESLTEHVGNNMSECVTTALKKKSKKRKKGKEESLIDTGIREEHASEILADTLTDVQPPTLSPPLTTASANLTPASSSQNLLATLRAAPSGCVTPLSSDAISTESLPVTSARTGAISTTAPNSTTTADDVVDTFDILKDANFYPLF